MEVELSMQQFKTMVLALPENLKSGDFTPALEACIPIVAESVGDNFARQATAAGKAWPPRKDKKPKHPLLILSGKLIRAAVGEGGSATGHIQEVSSHELNFGVSVAEVPYAATHQYGDHSRNIAQREYLAISKEAEERCHEIVEERVYEILFVDPQHA